MRAPVLRPSTFLLVLAAWFPFEDFVLKWVPVSDYVYSWLRLGSEAVIYALFVLVLSTYGVRRRSLRATPIDLPLLLFAICALLSIFVSGAPWLGSLINFRALVRYLAVFYIVIHIRPSPRWTRRVVHVVLVVATVQAVLAIAQYAAGDAFGTFFWPRATAVAIGGYQRTYTVLTSGLEVGAVMGTVGQATPLGLFLVVALALVAGRAVPTRLGRRILLFTLLLILATSLTYSRAATLAALAALPIAGVVSRSARWWKRLAMAGSLALLALLGTVDFTDSGGRLASPKDVALSPAQNLSAVSDAALWRSLGTTRLWLMREVGGPAISHGVLGYGADTRYARRAILEETGGRLLRVIEYNGFEDVFWVAMLVYYGALGLAAFWWLLIRLYRASRRVYRLSVVPIERHVALAFSTLVLLTFPLALMNNIFEMRTFSFYFWMLAGIVVANATRPPFRGVVRRSQRRTRRRSLASSPGPC